MWLKHPKNARAASLKLGGNSSFNVNFVCPVCPVCPFLVTFAQKRLVFKAKNNGHQNFTSSLGEIIHRLLTTFEL